MKAVIIFAFTLAGCSNVVGLTDLSYGEASTVEKSTTIEAGTPIEASTPIKASTLIEAGIPIEAASMPIEAGIPIEAGTPIEAGIPIEAGTEADGCKLVTHSNGLGASWQDCALLGTTNEAEAMSACEQKASSCNPSSILCPQGVPLIYENNTAWIYGGYGAGTVVMLPSCTQIGSWQ